MNSQRQTVYSCLRDSEHPNRLVSFGIYLFYIPKLSPRPHQELKKKSFKTLFDLSKHQYDILEVETIIS